MRIRWSPFGLAALFAALLPLAKLHATPVELLSASREVLASSTSDVASASPASPFGGFIAQVSADSESYPEIAIAEQNSSIGPWRIDVLLDSEADTDFFDLFGSPSSSSSSFEVVFEVTERVGYELSGRISAYDAVAQVSLTSVLSRTVTTAFDDPDFPEIGTFGSSDFDLSGVLEPGSYTLRASGWATPGLGGWGGAAADFSLQLLPLNLPSWLEFHALAEDMDLLSDDDADLVPLIMEYVFGTDPHIADAGDATPLFEFDPATGIATLSYPLELDDLSYFVEWSTDLVSWSSDGVTGIEQDGGTRARYTVPAGGESVVMRLGASLSE